MVPPPLRLILVVLGGFLLGSLPFSVWVGRRAAGVDVRREGSRNPGAANVWKLAGRSFGVLVGAADAAKGAAAVWLAWWAELPDGQAVWAGAAATLGHDFSPWLGFRGGKGGATTVGALACFLFPELLVVLGLWILASFLDPRRKFVWSIASLSMLAPIAAMTGRVPLPWLGGLPTRSPSVIAAAAFLILLLWSRIASGLARPHA